MPRPRQREVAGDELRMRDFATASFQFRDSRMTNR
jgi:hypothetical protein